MAARTYTPAQREAADQARRAQVEELHQQLADRVGTLDDQAEWQRYLTFARSFHRYSFGNRLLIMIQAPDATAVAGYRAWQAKGYQVRQGEKAIRVLGPVTRLVDVLDAAGHPVLDERGEPLQHREMVGVKPVPVFDISQTDGPPVPEPPLPVLLTGQAPPGLWESLAGLVAAEGYRLERGDCGRANGLTDYAEGVVRVRDDVDDAQAVKTLAHELGHVLLPRDEFVGGCRGLAEVEAESVAYMVTSAHGLDSSQYTFRYVTGWAARSGSDGLSTEQVVRATGQRVIEAVDKILAHTQAQPAPADEALAALEAQIDHLVDGPRWEPVGPLAASGVLHERAAHVLTTQRSPKAGVPR